MKLARIRLRRAPGLADGIELEGLGPGLNLIVGPNASGKSTFARAVRASLWKEESFTGAVEADWSRGEELLHSSRITAQRPTWSDDTGETESPRVPGAHLRMCFGVGLDDLLGVHADTDARIARELRLQLSDGQDLTQVLSEARARTTHRAKLARRTFNDAQRGVAEIERRHRDLAGEEGELRKLRASLEAARRAQSDLRHVQAALDLAELRDEAKRLEEQMAAFPGEMQRVPADLPKRRTERARTAREAAQELEAIEGQLAANEARLSTLDLEPEETEALRARPLVERADRLRELEGERDGVAREVEQHRGQLAELRAGLLDVSRPENTPSLGREALEALDAALEELAKRAARLEEARERAASLSPDGAAAGEEPPKAPPLVVGTAVLVATLLCLLILIWIPPADASWRAIWSLVALIAAAVGAALLWRSILERRARGDSVAGTERARALHEEAQRACELAEGRKEEAGAQRDRALAELGLDLAVGGLSAGVLARRLAEQEASAARLTASRQGLAQITAVIETELHAVADLLAEYRRAEPAEVAEARAALRALAMDAEEARAAHVGHSGLESQLERARARANRAIAKQSELYMELGLDPGDDAGLELRASSREEWTELSTRLGGKRAHAAQLESGLGERAGHAERGIDSLKLEIEDLQAQETEIAELTERIAKIDADVQAAREGDKLQLALAAREEARAELEARRAELEAGVVAQLLIDDVESSHRREAQPALVRRAAEHFERFTRARCTLSVASAAAPDDLPLEVLDDGRAKTITELSAGTRAQLRLALRLAVAEAAELGEALPLFLDEALATSDPERFEAIVVALGELAREGRQIFHLTSDADEAARFKEVLNTAGFEPAVRRDLDLAGRRARAASPLAPRESTQPPDPEGHTPDSYLRALEAPALDPRRPLEEQHLVWVLLDDLPALRAMLIAGGVTIARARALLERDWTDAWDASTVRRFELRLRALESFLATYLIGRGRRLDALDLHAGPVGGSTKLPQVIELAEELDWDARALLEALRAGKVKRFRNLMIEEAEADWTERGAYDDREPQDRVGCTDAAMRALDGPLREREISPSELREWCERWWCALEG